MRSSPSPTFILSYPRIYLKHIPFYLRASYLTLHPSVCHLLHDFVIRIKYEQITGIRVDSFSPGQMPAASSQTVLTLIPHLCKGDSSLHFPAAPCLHQANPPIILTGRTGNC
jgi:hypothetical protein